MIEKERERERERESARMYPFPPYGTRHALKHYEGKEKKKTDVYRMRETVADIIKAHTHTKKRALQHAYDAHIHVCMCIKKKKKSADSQEHSN